MANSTKTLPDIAKWQAAQLELVAFPSSPDIAAVIEQQWWEGIAGDGFESTRKKLERVDVGEFHGTQLRLTATPGRISWIAAPIISAILQDGAPNVYGLDEAELPDGSKAAGQIVPITDGEVQERLENVILSTIQPRPRFRIQKVVVTGGFVLVMEVYPSYDRDLHMVTGYKESRFYRRGEQSTLRMTEPEIREAYSRIAASMQALEASLGRCIESELALIPALQESVFVIPLFGHRRLVQPQQFGDNFGRHLAYGPLSSSEWHEAVFRLRVANDGYRGWIPDDGKIEGAGRYVSVLRNGVVHLANELYEDEHSKELRLRLVCTMESLITALLIAKEVLNRAAYWGPIRIVHNLRCERVTVVDELVGNRRRSPSIKRGVIQPGRYRHEVAEIHWDQISSSFKPVIREMLDQLFQTAGEATCPWFDTAGNWTSQTPQEITNSGLMAVMS